MSVLTCTTQLVPLTKSAKNLRNIKKFRDLHPARYKAMVFKASRKYYSNEANQQKRNDKAKALRIFKKNELIALKLFKFQIENQKNQKSENIVGVIVLDSK
jgi:hypothetical protein